MPLLSDVLAGALNQGERFFYDYRHFLRDPWFQDRDIDFKLLTDCITPIIPRGRLCRDEKWDVEERDVARIFITHQIQLLSKLMDYYKNKSKTVSSDTYLSALTNHNFRDGLLGFPHVALFRNDKERAFGFKQIEEIRGHYLRDTSYKLEMPGDDDAVMGMLRLISLLAESSVATGSTPVEQLMASGARTTPERRGRSDRPRETQDPIPRQRRLSRSRERRDPVPNRNRSDSPRRRRDSTHRQGRLSRSQEGQDFYPQRGQSRSNRPSHSYERQDLNPKREGGRSDRPDERQDAAPQEDLPTPPLRIQIKSGDNIRVTFRS
ncbi:hypothetical protein M431DRAFT_557497 [Trichoderma harzianum CBS 226.95]|uniref:Uncharacterized protein n=1 Tax=Trichoderma harzianum CBS 226.95 TaxID=983964 RepID=A0A2T4A7B5_TRIHA|nr:hypothetical protein M431DRAFT_557497 [Trichoderma harzianum CBS 226.95]PTB52926.1 hypothetical protein M431DRAFT_557497 [Trichoderma harzianum CBS 226.95]